MTSDAWLIQPFQRLWRVRSLAGPLLTPYLNSRFVEWRGRQRQPQTTTGFQSAMGEDNLVTALRSVTGKRLKL